MHLTTLGDLSDAGAGAVQPRPARLQPWVRPRREGRALAQWVLQEQPEWTPERIEAAMQRPGPQAVTVARPVRVMLFYTAAAVTPGDSTLHFAADIYRHDARLDAALARAGARP